MIIEYRPSQTFYYDQGLSDATEIELSHRMEFMNEFISLFVGDPINGIIRVAESRVDVRGERMKFKVYQKNDLLIRTTIEEEGTPYNLDGCDVFFVINAGSRCVVKKSLVDGIVVNDYVEGVIEIDITSNDTDQVPGKYNCEIVIEDINESRYTAVQGTFEIKRSYAKECLHE